jgi:pimeloyl-ACP methyl ester carboxylesterase
VATVTSMQRLPGTPEPAHRWQLSNGMTLAGDSWGPPDGPLVVLQHGGGQTRHAWKKAGSVLGAAGYRAIAVDARGHGDSGWAADGDYTQDVMVDDLVCLLEQLGGRRAALIGASMGGGVSLVAIGEGLVDASALVLVDIAPQIEPDGADRIIAFMSSRPDGFASIEEVADAISAYQPHRPRPTDLSGLSKNLRVSQDGRYHWHWDPRIVLPAHDYHQRYERLCACARAVTQPALIVRGGMSDVLSDAGARHFLEMCPHAEYVSIRDAAHMIAGDRNDVFGSAVVDFLGRHVPRDSGTDDHGHHRHGRARTSVVDLP